MDDELRGWKAIADYLGTSDRTAQRWERDLGLPVRRGGTAKGTTVVATPRDLDDWRSSPVGLRAEGEPSPDSIVPTTPAGAGDASGVQEPGAGSEFAAAVAPGPSGRSTRRWLVVGGATAALAFVAAVTWYVVSTSSRGEIAKPGTAGSTVRPPLRPGIGSVVVLKLTAPSGEAWSLRIKDGAMATWEGGAGKTLGIVAVVDGALVRVTLSETDRSNSGAQRRTSLGGAALVHGTSAPIQFAGAQMSLEWIGTEGPPAAAGPAATVAPPRCCVVCGGVTVCATEVAGWCGSCCDPRFTSCRTPQ
jgi:hypothetical protein